METPANAPPLVSIVMPVRNEGQLFSVSLTAVLASTDVPIEVIVIDDASDDGCCDFLCAADPPYANVRLQRQERQGAAMSRNNGARMARGEYLLFLDGHCFPTPGWLERLAQVAATYPQAILAPCITTYPDRQFKGYGGTVRDLSLVYEYLPRQGDLPYEAPLVGAGCMMARRDFFFDIGLFDNLRLWGLEDTEVCLRCWLLGYRVIVVPDVEVAHFFKEHGAQPGGTGHRDSYSYNYIRTAILHFDGERLQRALALRRQVLGYTRVAAELVGGDTFERYHFVRRRRKHDADWFCEKFSITL